MMRLPSESKRRTRTQMKHQSNAASIHTVDGPPPSDRNAAIVAVPDRQLCAQLRAREERITLLEMRKAALAAWYYRPALLIGSARECTG
jgi:hypothetical protein